MTTKSCPLCGGQQFFLSTRYPAGGIMLGAFKNISLYNQVCLACGSVSQALDDVGLGAIRELAGTFENTPGEKPAERDLREL